MPSCTITVVSAPRSLSGPGKMSLRQRGVHWAVGPRSCVETMPWILFQRVPDPPVTRESQLHRVVPTSGFPAPPSPSTRAQGPPPIKAASVRPGLAYCLPRPHTNPCSCRDREAWAPGRPACQSWETGKRNKSSKMFRCGGSSGRPQHTTPQPQTTKLTLVPHTH